ncbi:MAG: AtzG-like protein [Vulcanimicrobiaceae bacterium]|jgi:hypothetical protein
METYVDAAAAVAGIQLDDERRAAVITVMKRIAAFAADLDELALPLEAEIP